MLMRPTNGTNDVQVESFSWYGRMMPWEEERVWSLQEIQAQITILTFFPIGLLAIPMTLLYLLNILIVHLRRRVSTSISILYQ